jgi:integrase
MDASNLAVQTLQSSAAKALKGLNIAREYMNYGFTSLRDLGSVDPEWPTVDLRIGPGSGAQLAAAGGSALQPDEVRALFAACKDDYRKKPAIAARDAAIRALLYGCSPAGY